MNEAAHKLSAILKETDVITPILWPIVIDYARGLTVQHHITVPDFNCPVTGLWYDSNRRELLYRYRHGWELMKQNRIGETVSYAHNRSHRGWINECINKYVYRDDRLQRVMEEKDMTLVLTENDVVRLYQGSKKIRGAQWLGDSLCGFSEPAWRQHFTNFVNINVKTKKCRNFQLTPFFKNDFLQQFDFRGDWCFVDEENILMIVFQGKESLCKLVWFKMGFSSSELEVQDEILLPHKSNDDILRLLRVDEMSCCFLYHQSQIYTIHIW
jgi:hypothetical protein